MDQRKQNHSQSPGGTFTCDLCKWTEVFDYYGKEVPFVKNVTFHENCFVMKDPFSPPPSVRQTSSVEHFIAIGSKCKMCSKTVCKSNDCSSYYINTYCKHCSLANIHLFPLDMQSKIKKQLLT